MLNYNKNGLINDCLVAYYDTFAHTLDTADYVPEKYDNKILKYIFKNLNRQFKKLNKEDKLYQRKTKKEVRLEAKKAKKKARLKAKRVKKNKTDKEVKNNVK